MTRTTFNKLREVKDSLPHGSMAAIADELGIAADEVRAFFNGSGTPESGYHIEPGPDGGIVMMDDTRILEVALRIAWVAKNGL
ncbi:MAG: DNA-binding protein [Paludibacteraceae bacterium]|nr:DNA-binding protein [Paludibacteraceae bacterium]